MTKERSAMSRPLARPLSTAVEHLEDPFRDNITAGHVRCPENYCDEPDHLLCRRRGKAEHYHRPNEHDPMDEVRAAHQRCVQDGGDTADDNVAGECRQHRDVDSGPERSDFDHGPPPLMRSSVGLCRTSPAFTRRLDARISSENSRVSTPSLLTSSERNDWRFFAYIWLA